MHIDVYADIACPWCYVGRARLKEALAQRPDVDATLQWRPFQLQPDLPGDGGDFREVLERKFGSWDRAERMFDRIRQMGGEHGLTFNFDAIEAAPDTTDTHRLTVPTRLVLTRRGPGRCSRATPTPTRCTKASSGPSARASRACRATFLRISVP
jgi:hypothetical protein